MLSRRRGAFRLASILGILAVGAVAEGGPISRGAGDAAAFSRSAWIAAQRSWARFDGGVEPTTERAREALRRGAATTGGAFDRASDPWVAFGPDGRVYYATIAFNEMRPDNGVTLSASDDGGLTWGAPALVHLNRNLDFDDKEAVIVDTAADSPFSG